MSINHCKLATGARCRFVPSVGMTMQVTCCQQSQSLAMFKRLTTQIEGRIFPRTHGLSTNTAKRVFCSVPRQPMCIERLHNVARSCNRFLNVMAELFAKQCNAIAAQRTRRMAQIINLYSNLYDRQTVVRLMEKMGSHYLHKGKGRKIAMLLGACLFNWNQEQISTAEMDNCGHEIYGVRHVENRVTLDSKFLDHWEKVIDRDHLHAWRRPLPNSHLYEYKVLGTFKDIPARAFFKVQVDLEYRKQWDGLVISLDLIDRDEESGTEMVRWVMHFPYPMRAREYIYTRKYETYKDENLMVFVSRASEHPKCPITDEFVRVAAFSSKMVIKPHTTFDENGFDYILTYHDDPQATIPGIALRWMASTGVPNFVEQLHEAARGLHKGQGQREEEVDNDDNAIPM